jgi:hypothetical protein
MSKYIVKAPIEHEKKKVKPGTDKKPNIIEMDDALAAPFVGNGTLVPYKEPAKGKTAAAE